MVEQLKDFIGGTIRRGKRLVSEKNKAGEIVWKEVDAKYFNVIVYERDANGNPVQIGERKYGNKTYPTYKIATMLRLPEITLLKVASGEAKSCLMFWRPRQ